MIASIRPKTLGRGDVAARIHGWHRMMRTQALNIIDHTVQPLDEARNDIEHALLAARQHDIGSQGRYARAAIDLAATTLLDPTATAPQVVAARYLLGEGLALDGRPNSCGADQIDTELEASKLTEDGRRWLDDYLASLTTDTAGYTSVDYETTGS